MENLGFFKGILESITLISTNKIRVKISVFLYFLWYPKKKKNSARWAAGSAFLMYRDMGIKAARFHSKIVNY